MAIQSLSSQLPRPSGSLESSGSTKPGSVASGRTRSASVDATDRVQLTPEALHLRKQLGTSGKEPPMNEEKIQALRAAIADGSYQTDSLSIARKMMAFEDDLDAAFARG